MDVPFEEAKVALATEANKNSGDIYQEKVNKVILNLASKVGSASKLIKGLKGGSSNKDASQKQESKANLL